MATREYVGTAIVVHWDSARCIHSERCFHGAPGTFDPQARPWVQPDGTPVDDLAAVIDTCPSGALSYTRTDGGAHGRRGWAVEDDHERAVRADDEAHEADGATGGATTELGGLGDPSPDPASCTVITPREDGPLVVEGRLRLTAPDGSTTDADRLFLCRCGSSATKPLCDGTHKRVGFEADGIPVTRRPAAD